MSGNYGNRPNKHQRRSVPTRRCSVPTRKNRVGTRNSYN